MTNVAKLCKSWISKLPSNIIPLSASALIAVLLRYALPLEARESYSISFAPLIVCVALFVLFKAAHKVVLYRVRNRLETAITICLSLVFGLFIVFGAFVVSANHLSLPHFLLLCLTATAIAVPIFCLLVLLWDKLDSIEPRAGNANPGSRKETFILFLILLLAWTPYFLASYPGFFSYDTPRQWAQFEAGQLEPSSPVMHTLIMSGLMQLGRLFHDTFNFGIAFFTVCQAMFVAFVFAYTLSWIKRKGLSKWLYWGSLLYFALDPVINCFVLCSTKDVLFSAFAVLLMIFSYDLMEEAKPDKKTIGKIALFVVCGVAFCNIRYNGFYVFILWGILLLVAGPRRMKALLAGACSLVLLVSVLWTGCISDAIGVKGTGSEYSRVSLLIPQHQIGYVVENCDLSDDERALLLNNNYVFPTNYKDSITDSTNSTLNNMSVSQALDCYFYLGANHPGSYFVAVLKLTQDAWNPYSYVDCYNGYSRDYVGHETSFFEPWTRAPGVQDSKLPGFMRLIESINLDLVLQKIPLVSLLVSIPFYFWVMLLTLARAIISRNRSAIAVTSLLFICALSILVGPCALPRYYLPLFFGLPLMIFCGISQGGVNRNAQISSDQPSTRLNSMPHAPANADQIHESFG